jgi:hypothetical protein
MNIQSNKTLPAFDPQAVLAACIGGKSAANQAYYLRQFRLANKTAEKRPAGK